MKARLSLPASGAHISANTYRIMIRHTKHLPIRRSAPMPRLFSFHTQMLDARDLGGSIPCYELADRRKRLLLEMAARRADSMPCLL